MASSRPAVAALVLLASLQSASSIQQRAARADPGSAALMKPRSGISSEVDLAGAFERLASSRIDARVEALEESLHQAEQEQAKAAAVRKAAFERSFSEQSKSYAAAQKAKTRAIEFMNLGKLENEALRKKARALQVSNRGLRGLLAEIHTNVTLALDFLNLTISRSDARVANSSVGNLLQGGDGNHTLAFSLLQLAGPDAGPPAASLRARAEVLTRSVSDAIAAAAEHENKSVIASIVSLNAMLAAGEKRLNETESLVGKLNLKIQEQLALRKRLAVAVANLQQQHEELKSRVQDFSAWAKLVVASLAAPRGGASAVSLLQLRSASRSRALPNLFEVTKHTRDIITNVSSQVDSFNDELSLEKKKNEKTIVNLNGLYEQNMKATLQETNGLRSTKASLEKAVRNGENETASANAGARALAFSNEELLGGLRKLRANITAIHDLVSAEIADADLATGGAPELSVLAELDEEEAKAKRIRAMNLEVDYAPTSLLQIAEGEDAKKPITAEFLGHTLQGAVDELAAADAESMRDVKAKAEENLAAEKANQAALLAEVKSLEARNETAQARLRKANEVRADRNAVRMLLRQRSMAFAEYARKLSARPVPSAV